MTIIKQVLSEIYESGLSYHFESVARGEQPTGTPDNPPQFADKLDKIGVIHEVDGLWGLTVLGFHVYGEHKSGYRVEGYSEKSETYTWVCEKGTGQHFMQNHAKPPYGRRLVVKLEPQDRTSDVSTNRFRVSIIDALGVGAWTSQKWQSINAAKKTASNALEDYSVMWTVLGDSFIVPVFIVPPYAGDSMWVYTISVQEARDYSAQAGKPFLIHMIPWGKVRENLQTAVRDSVWFAEPSLLKG